MKIFKKDNQVFIISLLVTFLIVIISIIIPTKFNDYATNTYNFLSKYFGWLYLIVMLFFVVFILILACTKYGNIRLGKDDSKPEFTTTSWFAMLFGAGMGIGLVFWGVAEPMSQFVSGAFGIKPGSKEAANFAMKVSFMHWGIHPWANYSIIGLALAYFQFRKDKPGLISTIFIPLIGEDKVKGPIGKTIDILAVFATVAGVATSLGLGTLQINSGLNYVFNLPQTRFIQIGIIAIITVIYIWTAVSGIEKGIKVLSDINLWLAFLLVTIVFLIGPKLKIINLFTNGIGMYINSFIQDSLKINAFGSNKWIEDWTIFYWAWWIAWAPFVGSFIARISKGRTIREFVIGVIVAPSLASILWFSVFGGLGINLKFIGKLSVQELKQMSIKPEVALFDVLKNYPLATIISLIAVMLLCTFFITSANSATFVLGIFTSNGDLNPSRNKKIVWGIVQALLATSLLIAGGLKALQTASVVAAFPFIFVMIFTCISLLKAFKEEENIKENKFLGEKIS